MVPKDGLEPSLPKETDFESVVSTNSTTPALSIRPYSLSRVSERNYTFAFTNGKPFATALLPTADFSSAAHNIEPNPPILALEFRHMAHKTKQNDDKALSN